MDTKLVKQHLIDDLRSYNLTLTESILQAIWDAVGDLRLLECLAFISIRNFKARTLCLKLVVQRLKKLFVCRFCILVNLSRQTLICSCWPELFVECLQRFYRRLTWKVLWRSWVAGQSYLYDELQILLVIQRYDSRHFLAWILKANGFDDALNLILFY